MSNFPVHLTHLKILFIALLVMLSIQSHGDDPEDQQTKIPEQWDLSSCIQYALENNIQIRSLRVDQAVDEQTLIQAKGQRMPNLNSSVGQTYTNSKNTNPVIGGFQTQSNFAGTYSLNSNWTLFEGGYVKQNVEQNQMAVQQAALNVEQTANNITLQITQAYLTILYSKETVNYLKDVLTSSEAQLVQAKQKLAVGSIAQKDLAQIQSQYASDQYALVNAENNYQENILALKQILLIPSSQTFEVYFPKTDSLAIKETLPDFNAVYTSAYNILPQIKIGKLGVDMANLDLKKSFSQYWPTLSLNAGISTGYSDNQNYEYPTQLNKNLYERAGLSLSIPIYNRNTFKTNVEKSRLNLQKSNLNMKDAENTLMQNVEQAHLNAQTGQSRLKAAVDQLNAARTSYEISDQQFSLGMLNTVELLQQKNTYLSAEQEYTQAKYMAILNAKILDFYMGIPIKL